MKNVTKRVITTILAVLTVFAGIPGIGGINADAADWHEAENDTQLSSFEHKMYNSALKTLQTVLKKGGETYTEAVDYDNYNIKKADAITSCKKVMSLIKCNHPELLFWCSSVKTKYSNYYTWIYFTVFPEFRSDSSPDSFYADKEKIQNGIVALKNANNIIKKYADETDYNKINGYVKEICAYTDYNYDAYTKANDSSYTEGSGAWNIYWLFDGNPDTKVVCEGYAKGFQYLMDNTIFDDPSIKCKSVTGTGGSGSSAGPHMWNIVTIENKNYLIDTTWYDTTNNNKYILGADDNEHAPDACTAYTSSELALSDMAYDPSNQIVKEKLSFTGNVTLSGIYGNKLNAFTSAYTGNVTDKNGNVITGAWVLDPSENSETVIGQFAADKTVKVRFKADTDSDKYKVLQADAKLAISKRNITVKIKDAEMTVVQTVPAFTIEEPVTGLVGSDTVDDLALTLSTQTDGRTVGTFPITGTSASEHYNVTIQKGTLTVNEKIRKNLIATSAPKVRVMYGDMLSSGNISGKVTDDSGKTVTGAWAFNDSVNTSEIINKSTVNNSYKVKFTPTENADDYNTLESNAVIDLKKRPVTVVAKSYTITEGNPLPSFELESISGGTLVSGDTLDDLKVVLTSTAKGSTAGTYKITGTSSSAYYSVTVNPGTLTIKEKPKVTPTVTETPQINITYGQKITASSIVGGKAVYDGKTVPGTFSLSQDTNLAKIYKAGNYTTNGIFTPADKKAYNTANTTVTVNVVKKPVTVKINDKTITEGDALPAFSAMVTPGLVGQDKVNDIITYSCDSNASAKAGKYNITGAVKDKATDYDVTIQPGTLTVKEKEPEIVAPTISEAPSINITYGEKISDGMIREGRASYNGNTVAGTFSFASSVDKNKILSTGEYNLAGVFTPSDTAGYNSINTMIKVTVSKKPLTITIDNKTVTQGDAMPAFTASSDVALVGSDLPGDLVTISCNAINTDTTGTYAITGTVRDTASNYSVTVKNGTLTVKQKQAPVAVKSGLTVKTNPAIAGIYGNRLSTFNISGGIVTDNTGAAVAGTWSITDADRTVNKGNAANAVNLVFAPADAEKYKTAAVSVKLTVNKRPVTVKADDITKKVGETKKLTYHITSGNLVSGDTESDLGITLKASNTTDKEGNYDITGTCASDWYDVTINSGKLTITSASSQTTDTTPFTPAATYTISYDYNGGSGSNPAAYTKVTESFALTNPVRSGYTFTGWTGSNGNTPQMTVTVTKGTTGNLHFTANWTVNSSSASNGNTQPSNPTTTTATTYYITYNYDGGVAFGNPAAFTKDTAAFTLVNPSKTGYTFTGWSRNNESTTTLSMTVAKGTTGDVTFTAHWALAQNNDVAGNSSNGTLSDTAVTDNTDTEDDTDITLPKGKITKLYSSSNTVSMKYKKISVEGKKVKYQVAIKKAYAKKWMKSTTSSASKVFKGLKKDTTYWVSVRPYVTVNGEKIYGEWAKTLIKKTK